ncbi:hypothetical protein JCM8202_001619 [Rhodotorula sphaerocarpa]
MADAASTAAASMATASPAAEEPTPLPATLPGLPPTAPGGAPPPAAAPTPADSPAGTAPPSVTGAKGKGKGKGTARKAEETPEGEPKPKKKRTAAKKPAEGGPGKHWRKGLKGAFPSQSAATAAKDESVAGTPGATTPSGMPSHVLASSPAPSRASTAGVSSAIAPPPRMGNQFITVQSLHIGTPRPRKWIKSKMGFRRIDGRMMMLPSWQGDSYSAFATAVGTAEVDELASPPPAAPSNLAAATAAFAHRDQPRPSSAEVTPPVTVPKVEQSLKAPILPPLPGAGSAPVEDGQAAQASGAQGVSIQDAPAEQKMGVDAQAAGLEVPQAATGAAGSEATTVGMEFVPPAGTGATAA